MSTTNPFYDEADNEVDLTYHAAKYNNPGADVVGVLLTWNGGTIKSNFDFSYAINKHMTNAATLLRKIHSDFPNAKIICLGIQISSLNGGTGANYGATGTYSDMYATAFYAFDYNKALEELVTNEEFSEYCYYVDTKGQFDTEYNMPSKEIDVNDRFRSSRYQWRTPVDSRIPPDRRRLLQSTTPHHPGNQQRQLNCPDFRLDQFI